MYMKKKLVLGDRTLLQRYTLVDNAIIGNSVASFHFLVASRPGSWTVMIKVSSCMLAGVCTPLRTRVEKQEKNGNTTISILRTFVHRSVVS